MTDSAASKRTSPGAHALSAAVAFLRERQFILLAIALMAQLFVFPALSDCKIKGALVSEGFMFLVMLGIARSVANRRGIRAVMVTMLVVLMASRLLAAEAQTVATSLLAVSLNIALFGYILVLMMRFVLGSGRVTADKIDAAICVYLMYGLIGALSYSLVALIQVKAFSYSPALLGDGGESALGFSHFLYYSFITQTSLGFGDMTPVSSVARSLTAMHAATSQIYMTVLVARLVGLFTAFQHESSRENWAD